MATRDEVGGSWTRAGASGEFLHQVLSARTDTTVSVPRHTAAPGLYHLGDAEEMHNTSPGGTTKSGQVGHRLNGGSCYVQMPRSPKSAFVRPVRTCGEVIRPESPGLGVVIGGT